MIVWYWLHRKFLPLVIVTGWYVLCHGFMHDLLIRSHLILLQEVSDTSSLSISLLFLWIWNSIPAFRIFQDSSDLYLAPNYMYIMSLVVCVLEYIILYHMYAFWYHTYFSIKAILIKIKLPIHLDYMLLSQFFIHYHIWLWIIVQYSNFKSLFSVSILLSNYLV